MKFTLSWLKDHLDTTASVDEIAAALTDLGLEVETLSDPAKTLGAFTIAHVLEAVPHPNADKLRVCKVDTGNGVVQVVCGAPNARTGMKGVFARPGVYVPGTNLLLKEGEIRGQASMGMLCSERELMLSDDHNGIIDLPADAPLGARYIDYAGLNDPMIHIKITPNRPDALAVRGVARDLAARGLGTLKPAPVSPVPGAFVSPIGVSLHPDVADKACPLFIGRMIRGVRNGPSPAWLQQRLRAIGLRPINALVDVTNYLTFDRARPLHVFDAAKLSGNIHVRLSRPGETMLALDGKTYEFDATMTLVCDDAGPQAIGGVMGGELSGCTEATTDVFIEAAHFDPIRTAATGRKLKINSDARYRFERGVDPGFAQAGMELATRLILELCGGTPSELVIAGAVPADERRYTLRPERVVSLVGMDIPRAEQIRILRALEFTVADDSATITVTPPSFRPDVHGEADLVEEIARVVSLSKLRGQPLPQKPGVGEAVLTVAQRRVAQTRRLLAGRGLHECISWSFIPADQAALFGGGAPEMRLDNPISADMSDMRPSLLPGLLAASARNQARSFADFGLFEIGPEFFGPEPGQQRDVACALRVGMTGPRDWLGSRRPVDVFDAKADAEAVLAQLGIVTAQLMVAREAPSWYHPGRSGVLKLGPKVVLARFGELHPKVLKIMDVKGPAVACEVFLENLPAAKRKGTTRPALNASALQPVERDFAFVLDHGIEAGAVVRAALGADKKLIEAVRVFDHFSGPKAEAQLGTGKKSLAITVRLQPRDATLTDAEIEAATAKVVAAVHKATGGTLRG